MAEQDGPGPKKPIHQRVVELRHQIINSPEFQSRLAAGEEPDFAELTRQVTGHLMQQDAVESGDVLPEDPGERLNARAINFNKSLVRGVTAPIAAVEHGVGKLLGLDAHPVEDLRQRYLEPTYDPSPLGNLANIAGETAAEFYSTGEAMKPVMRGAAMLPGMGRAGTALASAAERAGGGPTIRAIAGAIPANVTGNLAYQGLTDPQSLLTPRGLALGTGYGVLGALSAGRNAQRGPQFTETPPVRPGMESVRNAPQPFAVEPSPSAQPTGMPRFGSAIEPNTPEMANTPFRSPVPNITGARPGMQAEFQPGAEMLRQDVARGPIMSYGGEQVPNFGDAPAPAQGPQGRRPLPRVGITGRELPDVPLDQTSYTPPPSRSMAAPVADHSSVRMQAEIARLRAESAALQGGTPQGPASPPRIGEIGWPEPTPEILAARGLPMPDKPFNELYPDTPPAEPMTPTPVTKGPLPDSPELQAHMRQLGAEAGDRAKANKKAVRILKPTKATVVAWRDPKTGKVITGEPGDIHSSLGDSELLHGAGWEPGFISGGKFVTKAEAGIGSEQLPEVAKIGRIVKPTSAASEASAVSPLETAPKEITGPGENFHGQNEYIQRVVEGGKGKREWVRNPHFDELKKLAGGGPAEGEPFPKPKRKAATKPKEPRTLKPTPKRPKEP